MPSFVCSRFCCATSHAARALSVSACLAAAAVAADSAFCAFEGLPPFFPVIEPFLPYWLRLFLFGITVDTQKPYLVLAIAISRKSVHLHLTGRASFVAWAVFQLPLPNNFLRVLRQRFRPPAKAQTSGERDDGLLLEKKVAVPIQSACCKRHITSNSSSSIQQSPVRLLKISRTNLRPPRKARVKPTEGLAKRDAFANLQILSVCND